MESRFDSIGDELLRMKDRTGHDMLLGMTHEEASVHLARNEATSYVKYPFLIYQIQTKFRDEPGSCGGLIRVREFTMKDAYSFHASQEDLKRQYGEVAAAYHRIFSRVGLPQVISVGSDTGMMGGKAAPDGWRRVSPWTGDAETGLNLGFVGALGLMEAGFEVMFDASLEGERNLIGGANRPDWHTTGISVPRDLPGIRFLDVARVNGGSRCRQCGGILNLQRGVEVGIIFQLGSKYTESMNMTYADADGQRRNPVMGCYGIGVGRLVACLIEANHDEYGPIWPVSVAPWQVHICLLNNDLEAVGEVGRLLYERLGNKFEVLMDDRGATAGVQFADADLLGIPVRIVVSKRNVEKGEVEISTRDKKIRRAIAIDQVESVVAELLS